MKTFLCKKLGTLVALGIIALVAESFFGCDNSSGGKSNKPESPPVPSPVSAATIMGSFANDGVVGEFVFTVSAPASVRALTADGKLKYGDELVRIKVAIDYDTAFSPPKTTFSFNAVGNTFVFDVAGAIASGGISDTTVKAKIKAGGFWTDTVTLAAQKTDALTIKPTDEVTDHTGGLLPSIPASYLGVWTREISAAEITQATELYLAFLGSFPDERGPDEKDRTRTNLYPDISSYLIGGAAPQGVSTSGDDVSDGIDDDGAGPRDTGSAPTGSSDGGDLKPAISGTGTASFTFESPATVIQETNTAISLDYTAAFAVAGKEAANKKAAVQGLVDTLQSSLSSFAGAGIELSASMSGNVITVETKGKIPCTVGVIKEKDGALEAILSSTAVVESQEIETNADYTFTVANGKLFVSSPDLGQTFAFDKAKEK